MTKIAKFFVLLLTLVPMALSAQQLKVLTFNIQGGAVTTLDSLADYIRQVDPDFVALQEVDVNTYRYNIKRHNGKNMISELAGKTGMFGHYGRTIDFAGGYYGIAMLSKYPSISTNKYELPNPGKKEPRVMIVGEFELPEGKTVKMACTHLDYLDDATRLAQANEIVSILSADTIPTIIAGDFNATPDDAAFRVMNESALNLTNFDFTFPSTAPKEKIDYIFAFPPSRFTLIETEVPQVILSDHLPVISTVKIE